MIKANLKSTRYILALCLISASLFARADVQNDLKRLYEARLLSFAMLGDYYMFSGLEGDTRYNREIESGVQHFEAHISQLTKDGQLSAKLKNLPAVLNQWGKFKKLLDTNRADFLVRGYADARLVDELGKNGLMLFNDLGKAYDELIQVSGLAVEPWTQHCRDMGLIIQAITSEYSARATSSLGQIMVLKINEGGMDKQAELFNGLLDKLRNAPGGNKKSFKLLGQVEVKWGFIAKSIKNYNENAVPFVINTYGDRIARDLETLGDHYSESVHASK